MGRSIWCKLPEDLRERVFAFLPISEVFKCRLVCKQWNSILTSQSFKELWTSFSPPSHWFLVYRSSEVLAAYDPASSKWTNIPLDHSCSLDSREVELMASAGGLLCFGSRYLDYSTLIVCNPLTKSQRFLPEMMQIRNIDIMGMVVDKTTNSYRILVTGTHETSADGSITELYDSTLGKWTHQCNSRKEFLQLWLHGVHVIWHKGVFYCLDIFSEEGYCRLLKYDTERREWADLDVKMPSHDIRSPSLSICGEKLLLVGEIVGEIVEDWSICIWEVKMDSLEGVRVDVMRREVFNEIGLPFFQTLHCQGNNNFVCLSTRRGWQSLVYNLSDGSWQFAPKNRACVKIIGRQYLVGMSYEPNLAAKV